MIYNIYTYSYGMHKPWRFDIICRPNFNLCTMSIYSYLFFLHIFVYLLFFFYLINYILLYHHYNNVA